MKNLKNQKGISLITIVIIIALLIIGIIMISSDDSGNGYEMDSKEVIAYTNLRTAIETSKVKGSAILSMENYNILGNMAKNADSTNRWFNQTEKVAIYGNTGDRDGYEVTWISDGTYCAIFYAKNVDNTYYLTNYNFSVDDVKGHLIFVEN